MKSQFLIFFLFLLTASFSIAQNSVTADDKGYIVKLGQMAPDFTINYLDGTTKKLSDFRGKIVMLQFTASWCSVCRKEMPHIESKIWQPYKDKGLILLGVDRREPKEKVEMFAKEMNITYPLVLDEESKIFELYAAPNAGVTRNVIVGKDGKIIFMTRLFDEVEFAEMVTIIKNNL